MAAVVFVVLRLSWHAPPDLNYGSGLLLSLISPFHRFFSGLWPSRKTDKEIRKHSSRIRTTHPSTVRASITRPPVLATWCHQQDGLGPGKSMHGVQCIIVGNYHIGNPPSTSADIWWLLVRSNASSVMVTWDPSTPTPVNRKTNMTENITFPQLCWRSVIKQYIIFSGSSCTIAQ